LYINKAFAVILIKKNMEIKGKVIEYETGDDIIGANIYIPVSRKDFTAKIINSKSIGTISNETGNFILEVPNNEQNILFTYIGRKPKLVNVREFSQISENNIIKMVADAELEEIVVKANRIDKKDNKNIYFILFGLLLLLILIYVYRQRTGDKPIVNLV
jgi:hypothetical protein